jgi:hypothetical protein
MNSNSPKSMFSITVDVSESHWSVVNLQKLHSVAFGKLCGLVWFWQSYNNSTKHTLNCLCRSLIISRYFVFCLRLKFTRWVSCCIFGDNTPTPSGFNYKQMLLLLMHWIINVSSLKSGLDTLIFQCI